MCLTSYSSGVNHRYFIISVKGVGLATKLVPLVLTTAV